MVTDFVWSGKHKLSHNYFSWPVMLTLTCLCFREENVGTIMKNGKGKRKIKDFSVLRKNAVLKFSTPNGLHLISKYSEF